MCLSIAWLKTIGINVWYICLLMSINFDTLNVVDVEAIYKTLFKKFNVDSDRGLSFAFGLSESAVRGARNRQSLPWEGVIVNCVKEQISLDSIFGIEDPTLHDKVHREKQDVPQPFGVEDLLAANALVDKILDDELFNKNLPPDRELLVRKKLQPVLIKAVFEHNFNEIFVKTIAQGALVMA